MAQTSRSGSSSLLMEVRMLVLCDQLKIEDDLWICPWSWKQRPPYLALLIWYATAIELMGTWTSNAGERGSQMQSLCGMVSIFHLSPT